MLQKELREKVKNWIIKREDKGKEKEDQKKPKKKNWKKKRKQQINELKRPPKN